MTENASHPVVPAADCAQCRDEGVRFVARDGRTVAEACVCAAACPKCGGKGRVWEEDARGYSRMIGCACGADPRKLSLLTGLRIPPRFAAARLSAYQPRSEAQARALGRATRFVDELIPGAPGARALLLYGPPGTGKTHLLCGILRELALHKGVRGRYAEFFLLLSDIKDGYSNGTSTRAWLEPLREVDVLAIDEVGKGASKNREFEQGVLDEIVSVRYNAGRPTLLATNYPKPGSSWQFRGENQLAETLDQRVGPRIYSRLHELCDFVEVNGTDFREDLHEERERAQRARRGLPGGAAKMARLKDPP